MYRGHRLDVLALIALLEENDQVGALRLAGEAQVLRQGDPVGLAPVLHNAILVAAGEGDAETVQRVQKAAGRKVGALPAVWCLALSLRRAEILPGRRKRQHGIGNWRDRSSAAFCWFG